jgi:tetratricopeptide (TPR) repeat protein
MLKHLFTAAAVLFALVPATARAEWRKYETAHFIIYSEAGEKGVTRLAEGLETVDGLMRMATALRPQAEPVKVRIYEVADNGKVEQALGVTNSGIAGFYHANTLGPFAVTPRRLTFGVGSFTRELVLHHEYAHHFMLQYFPATYPSWYVEGFAELMGSSDLMGDGRVAYGMPAKHRGDRLATDWVPVQNILLRPAEKLHGLDLYGQGWALTHFLTFSKERSPQLRRYLAALTAGRSQEEAAKAFGDLAELNREAHKHVVRGEFPYRPVSVPISRPLFQKIAVVSPAEADLIPETIAFRDDDLSGYRKAGDRAKEKRLREANLDRTRAKAARHPNDPYGFYLLSEVEYAAGNFAAAEAAANRVLTLAPGHVPGMARKSLAISQQAAKLPEPQKAARAAEARALATRANRANPDEPLPLLAFYQSFRLAGAAPSKNAVEGLEAVVASMPQQGQYRQLLVDEYARQRRWRDAIKALTPIANDPHDSPTRDAAREQLAKLQAELAKSGGTSTGSN